MANPFEERRVLGSIQGWAGIGTITAFGAVAVGLHAGWPGSRLIMLIGAGIVAAKVVRRIGQAIQRLDQAIETDPAVRRAYRHGEADHRSKERAERITEQQAELRTLHDAKALALERGAVGYAQTFDGKIAVVKSRLRQFGG